MSIQGQRILVTGGTGFIGGRLVEQLMLNHQVKVRAVVRDFRRAIRMRRFDVELVGASLTDQAVLNNAMKDCDTVFHCAFGSSGNAQQQRETTVDGTRSLLEAAQSAGVKRFINLSTLSVYGDLTTATLNEESPRHKSGDLYADTKLAAEQLVLAAHHASSQTIEGGSSAARTHWLRFAGAARTARYSAADCSVASGIALSIGSEAHT